MDETASDEELMQRYRGGDAQAFDLLYARHRAPLFRYFLRLVGPAAVAEELFQDVWMNLIRARSQYEARAKFTTWLYRMAHNRLVDHYRRTSTAAAFAVQTDAEDEALEAAPDDPVREPENEFERRQLGEKLVKALNELSPVQREAFLMREEGGLSLEELAAVTGVNVETAKSRVRYAVAKLQRRLAATRTNATRKQEQS